MVPFKERWEAAGRGVDWLIRGQFVVQLLIALGIGKIVQWVVAKYGRVPPTLAMAVWFLVSGALVWLLLIVFRKKTFVQETALEAVAASSGTEDGVRAVAEFYRTGSGPFLDEVEAHFQRLAAHHRDVAEREKFLVKALSGGAVAYLHDMTWASIFKSQLEALNELNRCGAMTADGLRPFYDAAKAAYPDTYRSYPFDSWWHYLLGQNIIRQDGNVLQVTVRGKDFLKYLVQSGRSANDKRN